MWIELTEHEANIVMEALVHTEDVFPDGSAIVARINQEMTKENEWTL